MSNFTGQINDTMILKSKALKVKLHRKKLARNTTDKELSQLLADMKNVKTAGAVRVNKTLFSKTATDPYMKIISEAGKYFYRMTTPWDDKGFRLLKVGVYKDFTKAMKNFTRDFREAVEGFINSIESDMTQMAQELGQAFNRADYDHLFLSNGDINREFLMEKFNLEVEFDKISDSDTNDLRSSLTDADREILAEEIEKTQMAKFAKAQASVAQDLYDCIEAIHERLSDTDNIFRDSLVENLEDLCDLIPSINIGEDQTINDLAVTAKAELCSFAPQELRDDPVKRQVVSKKADKLLNNLDGVI